MRQTKLGLLNTALLATILGSAACSKEETYTATLKKMELVPSTSDTSQEPNQQNVEWLVVDEVSNVATAVKKEQALAAKDGKKLVVYVSAVWCKPCKEFYEASQSPGFGSELSHLRLMKFDWDRHQTPLIRAGYGSQYLPLFALPNSDGKASEARFHGARFKGKEGVEDLKKRLLKITSSN